MSAEEINAKAIIAAALIRAGHIGDNLASIALNSSWVESDQLLRLNLLTQRVYDAITSLP